MALRDKEAHRAYCRAYYYAHDGKTRKRRPRGAKLTPEERLEAAWKREKADAESDALAVGGIVEAARTTEKSSAVGNAAAMREALCDIVMLTMKVGYSIHGDVACGIIASKAKHALAAPPRQCDIGTAEEQAERYLRFCRASKPQVATCDECPLANTNAALCEFAWAQMPYEAERQGEDNGSV